jgi:hypothetical protein
MIDHVSRRGVARVFGAATAGDAGLAAAPVAGVGADQ